MHPYLNQISKINLFKSLSLDTIEQHIFKDSIIKSFEKGEVIKGRGDCLNHMIVLLFGKIQTEIVDFNGKIFVIEQIKAPFVPAIGFIFSKVSLPMDIIAVEKTTILFIKKEEIFSLLMKNKEFLEIFLENIGNKVNFLSNKLQINTLKTIREKIFYYLIQLYNQQMSDKIVLQNSLEELSQLFGIARPSLSRVFSDLEKEGIILKKKNEIKILNKDYISNLFENKK
ncbi:Crp/Fnr family transcriptional regulator [Tepiditoga spiralis]|uniref:Crp/Fnr family transcriptional regulator n=1 Tax=Tepiditoga spiralis TaxID=2108365 RepID=A0A7G1GAS5_9BACT|nr:Crp/Fnr family transcriptional regulator [Tepiditoga spiralis]BBE31332.1 Crp/Fnr family transcriptional regulator [Tepiditoga spiralis]